MAICWYPELLNKESWCWCICKRRTGLVTQNTLLPQLNVLHCNVRCAVLCQTLHWLGSAGGGGVILPPWVQCSQSNNASTPQSTILNPQVQNYPDFADLKRNQTLLLPSIYTFMSHFFVDLIWERQSIGSYLATWFNCATRPNTDTCRNVRELGSLLILSLRLYDPCPSSVSCDNQIYFKDKTKKNLKIIWTFEQRKLSLRE